VTDAIAWMALITRLMITCCSWTDRQHGSRDANCNSGGSLTSSAPRIASILQERPCNAVHHGDSPALVALARTVVLQCMQQGASRAEARPSKDAVKHRRSMPMISSAIAGWLLVKTRSG
jgi:hypothetical protein